MGCGNSKAALEDMPNDSMHVMKLDLKDDDKKKAGAPAPAAYKPAATYKPATSYKPASAQTETSE
jgi:hypothetical protein